MNIKSRTIQSGFLSFFVLLFFNLNISAQEYSPYNIKPKIDLPILAAGMGLSGAGLAVLKSDKINPQYLNPNLVEDLGPEDVNPIDRSAAYQYSPDAETLSDIFFYGAFPVPFVLLFDNQIRSNSAEVGLMYLQALSLTAISYTFTAGLTSRKRPWVYNTDLPMELRAKNGNLNSFYNGHLSLTTSISVFTAKIYSDFHPNRSNKALIWMIAGIPPAIEAYSRYKAGKHFFTDSVVGLGVGTAIGLMVPELHKRNSERGLSLNAGYRNILISYKF